MFHRFFLLLLFFFFFCIQNLIKKGRKSVFFLLKFYLHTFNRMVNSAADDAAEVSNFLFKNFLKNENHKKNLIEK